MSFNPNAPNPSPEGPYLPGPKAVKGINSFEIIGNPLGVIDDKESELILQETHLFRLPIDILKEIQSYLDHSPILLSICKQAHKATKSFWKWVDVHQLRKDLVGWHYFDLTHQRDPIYPFTLKYTLYENGTMEGMKFQYTPVPGSENDIYNPRAFGQDIPFTGIWFLTNEKKGSPYLRMTTRDGTLGFLGSPVSKLKKYSEEEATEKLKQAPGSRLPKPKQPGSLDTDVGVYPLFPIPLVSPRR